MMQPARQMRAMVGIGSDQLNSGGCGRHHSKALSVSGNLGGKQGVFEIGDEGRLISRCLGKRRQAEEHFSSHVVLHAATTARAPATAASMPEAVTARFCASMADHLPVPFWPAASTMISTIGLPVSGSVCLQHLFGDLDQVGVEAALVPLTEDRRRSSAADMLQAITQDAVDLGDHLHVGIFDAVVDRLDEVTGAIGAEPGDARVVVELGRDRGQNRLDALPALLGAADHDRRDRDGRLLRRRIRPCR